MPGFPVDVFHTSIEVYLVVIDDQDFCGNARHIFHTVGDDHDRTAGAVAVISNEVENLVPSSGVKASGRLIKDEHLWLHGHNASNGDSALFTAGEIKW